jgi:predicted  nucleic acid-binding Zn-ribbon protein
MLRIQEMENEEINNRKELIKKNIENTDLKEQNIQCLALQDKLNKTIDRKNKLTKGSIIANNSLKKLNDDNQRQIIDLNSEIYILEKKYKDKEEYIKELNEENIKQKNEILRLKKDNETLYKIIHNKK